MIKRRVHEPDPQSGWIDRCSWLAITYYHRGSQSTWPTSDLELRQSGLRGPFKSRGNVSPAGVQAASRRNSPLNDKGQRNWNTFDEHARNVHRFAQRDLIFWYIFTVSLSMFHSLLWSWITRVFLLSFFLFSFFYSRGLKRKEAIITSSRIIRSVEISVQHT